MNDQPAFPCSVENYNAFGGHRANVDLSGMSLRDYFAAKAMQGLFAGCPDDESIRNAMNPDLWAKAAYRMADAMLAQREKNSGA